MVRNLLALTGLAAIALIAAVALQAYGWRDDDGLPPPRLAVSYVGLDLTTPEGVRLLEGRINTAIAEVCPREDGRVLAGYRTERRCRERAIAMVEPQVDRAIAAAEARARPLPPPPLAYEEDDSAEADRLLPPYPAPLPVVQPSLAPLALPTPTARRLVRRTTTTTVVTTTRTGPAASAGSKAKPSKPAVRLAKRRSSAYARLPDRPGSWLPPAAWRAIDRANARAFATGRLTRWASPGRSGYVTISAARRVRGLACRNVRVVKQNGTRQIVVAEGTRCRLPGGRIVARDCP